ncbi:MAG: methyltransferase domain-containing protein [Vicinamibacterales bacterium]|nr:methyltransferase domain-containing protein [Vicinamibacterales bacterium]
MFLRFLRRQPTDPLHVSMMGVRMGERVLQIGCDDPTLLGGVSLKVGLSGTAACIVTSGADAARAERAGADAGALLDVQQTPLATLPFDAAAFDLIVVDDTAGTFAARAHEEQVAALGDALRVLRAGGRIEIVEGLGTGGLRSKPIARRSGYAGDALLTEAGFRPVRLLAERTMYRFYEGLRPAR